MKAKMIFFKAILSDFQKIEIHEIECGENVIRIHLVAWKLKIRNGQIQMKVQPLSEILTIACVRAQLLQVDTLLNQIKS